MRRRRAAAGMKPQDPGIIPDAALRLKVRTEHMAQIEDGLRMLQVALQLNPDYSDAMAYMNLLYRLQAGIVDSQAQSTDLIAQADSWVTKALAAKRKQAQSAPSAALLDVDGAVPGAPAPPPPPPPPPPGRLAAAIPTGAIRVEGNAQQEKLVSQTPPVYPPLARQAGVTGAVRLRVLIGKDGTMRDIAAGERASIAGARGDGSGAEVGVQADPGERGASGGGYDRDGELPACRRVVSPAAGGSARFTSRLRAQVGLHQVEDLGEHLFRALVHVGLGGLAGNSSLEHTAETEDVLHRLDTVGGYLLDQDGGFAEHVDGLALFAFVPQVPGGGVDISEGGGGHTAGETADHFIDQGLAVRAGEDVEPAVASFAEGRDAVEGLAGFILDVTEGRDGLLQLDQAVDAEIADGLREEREPGGRAHSLVVLEERGSIGAAGRQGDDGVGAVLFSVGGVANRGGDVGGLHADDDGGTQAFAGGSDDLGAGEAFGFGEGGPFAGDLGPDAAVNVAAIEEADLRGQDVEIELVRIGERGLRDRKNSLEWLG